MHNSNHKIIHKHSIKINVQLRVLILCVYGLIIDLLLTKSRMFYYNVKGNVFSTIIWFFHVGLILNSNRYMKNNLIHTQIQN